MPAGTRVLLTSWSRRRNVLTSAEIQVVVFHTPTGTTFGTTGAIYAVILDPAPL